jgi:hypothetical protein
MNVLQLKNKCGIPEILIITLKRTPIHYSGPSVNDNNWFYKNHCYLKLSLIEYRKYSAPIGRNWGLCDINISLIENLSLIETMGPHGRWIINKKKR